MRNINPMDRVDLVFLAESYNDDIGTIYVQATVYSPTGAVVSGSPFTLTQVAGTNLFVNRNAFQADTDSGTYIITYQPYSDSGFTTKSDIISQSSETVTVKIQSSSGLGGAGNGQDIFLDNEELLKEIKIIKEEQERAKKRELTIIKKLGKIDLQIPEDFNKEILDELLLLKSISAGEFGKMSKSFSIQSKNILDTVNNTNNAEMFKEDFIKVVGLLDGINKRVDKINFKKETAEIKKILIESNVESVDKTIEHINSELSKIDTKTSENISRSAVNRIIKLSEGLEKVAEVINLIQPEINKVAKNNNDLFKISQEETKRISAGIIKKLSEIDKDSTENIITKGEETKIKIQDILNKVKKEVIKTNKDTQYDLLGNIIK